MLQMGGNLQKLMIFDSEYVLITLIVTINKRNKLKKSMFLLDQNYNAWLLQKRLAEVTAFESATMLSLVCPRNA